MNAERAAKIAAARLGISGNEYCDRRAVGEKWCCGCQSWHSIDAFVRDRAYADGRAKLCREAYRIRYGFTQTCVDCGGQRSAASGQRCAGCYKAYGRKRRVEALRERGYRIVVRAHGLVNRARAFAQKELARAQRKLEADLRKLRDRGDAICRKTRAAVARLKAYLAKQRVRAQRLEAKQALLAERAAERERVRAMKSARWWREKPEQKLPLSLDALSVWEDGGGSEFYERVLSSRVEDPFAVVVQDSDSTSLWQIVGDMTPEDVQRMTAWDLDRLRSRLADAGLVPDGVQDAERDRLRDPTRHAGAKVQHAPSLPGKKKRREKVAHKAANRARGNSNRPSQKPKSQDGIRELRRERQREREAA